MLGRSGLGKISIGGAAVGTGMDDGPSRLIG